MRADCLERRPYLRRQKSPLVNSRQVTKVWGGALFLVDVCTNNCQNSPFPFSSLLPKNRVLWSFAMRQTSRRSLQIFWRHHLCHQRASTLPNQRLRTMLPTGSFRSPPSLRLISWTLSNHSKKCSTVLRRYGFILYTCFCNLLTPNRCILWPVLRGVS